MGLSFLNPLNCDAKYAFARGASIYDTRLMRGGAVLADMAAASVPFLKYEMDEEYGGLLVGDFITNSDSHLLVTRKLADAIVRKFNLGPVELIPAKLLNEKKRVHFHDAVVIHPVEPIDCLDWERSDIGGDDTYRLVRIFGRWMLRGAAVPPDRDLLRVKGLLYYVFSERLVDFVQKSGFANFVFEDVRLS
jgi:hypothetical protein